MEYPAITLWQPWASFIAWGWKTIETRGHRRFSWLCGHRIAIHAGKRYDPEAWSTASQWVPPDAMRHWWNYEDEARQNRGKLLCTANVHQFRELTADDSAQAMCPCGAGRFGLFLDKIEVLNPPVPARGAQGVWTWNRKDGAE